MRDGRGDRSHIQYYYFNCVRSEYAICLLFSNNFLFVIDKILYKHSFFFQNAIRTQKALALNQHMGKFARSHARYSIRCANILYLLADHLKYVNVHLDSIHRIIINDGWLWEFCELEQLFSSIFVFLCPCIGVFLQKQASIVRVCMM